MSHTPHLSWCQLWSSPLEQRGAREGNGSWGHDQVASFKTTTWLWAGKWPGEVQGDWVAQLGGFLRGLGRRWWWFALGVWQEDGKMWMDWEGALGGEMGRTW